MRKLVWIDIDNPPQVQYLLPFKEAFERRGYDVVVTARDYSITFNILRERGASFVPCGKGFGRKKLQKALGVFGRTASLVTRFATRRPEFVVSSSRSSSLAARLLRIPSYIICDYEFAELDSYRKFGSSIVYPEVIGAGPFRKLGFPQDRLIPFAGIKEDLTFSAVDLDAIAPYPFNAGGDRGLVLFRPPAVEGHYYRSASGDFAGEVLRYLSQQPDVVVVYSPRYRWQVDSLAELEWANQPIVLADGVEFVSLLKGVDAVIASGGTMAREAAYLGIPSFSIFKGTKCAVDSYLESTGRLTFIQEPAHFDRLKFSKRASAGMGKTGGPVLDRLVNELLQRSSHAG
jgi:predicted glycosyltransferase